MSYYQHHVLFCTNQREPGERGCCNQHGASELLKYAKNRIRDLDLNAPGKVRVQKAGCMERCEEGPILVVYPEGVWYTYVDQADIDEIIDEHILNGRIVERLRLPDHV